MSELENQEKLVMAETIEVIDESVSENITEENLNDENVVENAPTPPTLEFSEQRNEPSETMEANNESTYHLPVKSPGIASNEMAGESGIIEMPNADDNRGDEEVDDNELVDDVNEDDDELQELGDATNEGVQQKISSFPLAKIKKIMKSDPETHLISKEAILLTAKATELFVREFASFSFEALKDTKRKTVSKKEFDAVLELVEPYCFLDGVFYENDAEEGNDEALPDGVETVSENKEPPASKNVESIVDVEL